MSEACWCYRKQAWSLCLSTGEHWTGDMIWIATGCKLDVKQDPLLSEVMKEFPIQASYREKLAYRSESKVSASENCLDGEEYFIFSWFHYIISPQAIIID